MRRAQAAMEFMTTYGWAIMVLLLAIGALAYFGVLDVNSFTPERCVVSAGFTCESYILNVPSRVYPNVGFVLRNTLGKPIQTRPKTFELTCDQCPSVITHEKLQESCYWIKDSSKIPVGDSVTFGSDGLMEFSCGLKEKYVLFGGADKRMKVKYSFEYTEVDGDLPHSVEGFIDATVGATEN